MNLTDIHLSALLNSGTAQSDYRTQVCALVAATKAQRQRELSELCSQQLTAQQRIYAWEKLHGVRLPLKINHPILAVVASNTGLALGQVKTEQQHRISSVKPAVADAV